MVELALNAGVGGRGRLDLVAISFILVSKTPSCQPLRASGGKGARLFSARERMRRTLAAVRPAVARRLRFGFEVAAQKVTVCRCPTS